MLHEDFTKYKKIDLSLLQLFKKIPLPKGEE